MKADNAATFELRAAQKEDIPALLVMNTAAVPAVNEIDADAFSWFIDNAWRFQVFMNDANELGGFMVALRPGIDYASTNYQWFSKTFADFAYVDRIVVAESARGHGLGRRLYEDLAGVSRDHVERITCEVNTRPPNPQSMAFHERLGFTQVGAQDTEGGSKQVALLSMDINSAAT